VHGPDSRTVSRGKRSPWHLNFGNPVLAAKGMVSVRFGSKAANELNNQHGGVPIKVSWSW